MPYIQQGDRIGLDNDYRKPRSAGELNYALTGIVLEYIEGKGEGYQTYCDIEGVLGHISKELYRRRVAPYEEVKIKENGDVSGFERS